MVVKVTLNIVLLGGFPTLVQCSTVAEQKDRKMTQVARLYCSQSKGRWIQQVPSGCFTA